MKKLLLAYDGSPAADSAINDLIHAALPERLDVIVMSVADVYLPAALRLPEAPVPEFPPSLVQKTHDKALHEVETHRALATRACARIHSLFPKWNCTTVAVADSPGWGLVRKATEWKADLIVVGAQSHSRLERLFLGSVSHQVTAEAPCSVRIGRHHRATDELRVIVAVDGSIDSKAALQEIASRAWRPGTKFRLVIVVDPHIETAMSWPGFLPENFTQTNDESGREWISRMAEAASRVLFDAGLDVSNYIYEGDPKEVLVRVSAEWHADAIFLGARGLNHGNRLSLGTVASSVASRAHCSVELVRPRP
jgi:nucleotide-binding universal stress UspA family protein